MKHRSFKFLLLLMIVFSFSSGCSPIKGNKDYESYISYRGAGGKLTYFEWIDANRPKGSKQIVNETISISSIKVDEKGHLIITLTNGTIYDGGKLPPKKKKYYSVNFYCDDLLIKTEQIKTGKTIKRPSFDGLDVKGWYLDKEKKKGWDFELNPITSATNLYADYEAKGTRVELIDDKCGHTFDRKVFYVGEKYELPTLIDRSSKYRFLGWMKEKQIDVARNGTWDIASSTTLVAKWREKLPFEVDYFGIFPQSLVTDPILLKELDKKTSSVKEKSYISYFEHGGAWYRKRPRRGAPSKSFNKPHYFLNGKISATDKPYYYFRFDPVKWILIRTIEGEVLAVTEKILDVHYYAGRENEELKDRNGNVSKQNEYENSYVRSWLNNINFPNMSYQYGNGLGMMESDFYLNDKEKEMLKGHCFGDKLFLLSKEEGEQYLTKEERKASLTDFAICYRELEPGFKGAWGTRSKGSMDKKIIAFNKDGVALDWGSDHEFFGVRFAVKLDKEKLQPFQKVKSANI